MWQPTSTQIKTISAGLGLLQGYDRSKTVERQGKMNRDLANIRADQLLEDAKKRFAAGVREGAEYSRRGRVTESDAIAAMAAGGGGVDPEMLARLKQKANYNTMSAIYDSAVAASDIRNEAANVRSAGQFAKDQADIEARDIRFSSAINAFSELPLSFAQKPSVGASRPKGYKANASQLNTWRSR